MTSQPPKEILVRCMCGRRYRIRQPHPGWRGTCPACGSLIDVTAADLETDFAADGSICIHEEDPGQAQEAILLEAGDLRPARTGARPGVGAGTVYTNEDALLGEAIGGRRLDVPIEQAACVGYQTGDVIVRHRPFIRDLLASFYFAGNKDNALNIGLTALAIAIYPIIGGLLPGIFKLIVFPLYGLVILYAVQFYWLVLVRTAAGEDDMPWFESDWSWWHDALKPLLWVACISLICSLPGLWVHWYMPPAPEKKLLTWGLLAVGWFFWPVAVMSAALGNTILFIRPDWLVRCVWGIGPVYAVAWVLVMATLAAWLVFAAAAPPPVVISVPLLVPIYLIIAAAVDLYFGYVLFRMLGLLFRHFRERFPWKY